MRKNILLAVTFLTLSLSSVVYAGDASVGLKAGTLGGGVEAGTSFSESFGVRIGVNYFEYGYSATEDDIDYDVDVTLASVSALLDWHPLKGAFRISAGVLYNGNEIDMEAESSSTYDVGDITFTSAQVGTLSGDIDFNDVAPYAGLGWDTSFGHDNRFGFNFDLGVMYQGSPDVSLSANGTAASNPTFQSELAKEEKNLEDELDQYEYYPVIALGLNYRF